MEEYNNSPAALRGRLIKLAQLVGLGLSEMRQLMSELGKMTDSQIRELIFFAITGDGDHSLDQPTPAAPVHIAVPSRDMIGIKSSDDRASTTGPSTPLSGSRPTNRTSSRSDLTSTSGSLAWHKCSYCPKRYKRLGYLTTHLLKHGQGPASAPNGPESRIQPPPDPAGQRSHVQTPLPQQNPLDHLGGWVVHANTQPDRRDDGQGLPHTGQTRQYPPQGQPQPYAQQPRATPYRNSHQTLGFNRNPAGHIPQAPNNAPPGPANQQLPVYTPGPQQPNSYYGTMPGPGQMANTHHAPRQPPRFNHPPHNHIPQAPGGNMGGPDATTNVTNPAPGNGLPDDLLDGEFDFTFNT